MRFGFENRYPGKRKFEKRDVICLFVAEKDTDFEFREAGDYFVDVKTG